MQDSYLAQLLWVGLGGFVGSVGRFTVSVWAQRLARLDFPIGTLTVNVVGCFAIGLVAGMIDLRTSPYRGFLVMGVLGGFTTFSTFSFETLELLRHGAAWKAGLNVLVQVAFGLLAAWLGLVASRLF